MLNPVRGAIGIPVLHSQLGVGHSHCLEVFLDTLQAVLVSWVRKNSDINIVVEQNLEESVIS